MSPAATRESIVARIRTDGRSAEALGLLLGRRVSDQKTTAIRCLDAAHADHNASAVIEPRNGRVTCRGCNRSWGLLEPTVQQGLAADLGGAARYLEKRLYGALPRPPSGSTTPARLRNPPVPGLNVEVSVPVPQGVCGQERGTTDLLLPDFLRLNGYELVATEVDARRRRLVTGPRARGS